MAESVQQFAARIKAKYPEYAEIEDRELVTRIVEKYPEYRDAVSLSQPTATPSPATATSPLPAAEESIQGRLARRKAEIVAGGGAPGEIADAPVPSAPVQRKPFGVPSREVPMDAGRAANDAIAALTGGIGGVAEIVGGAGNAAFEVAKEMVTGGMPKERGLSDLVTGEQPKVPKGVPIPGVPGLLTPEVVRKGFGGFVSAANKVRDFGIDASAAIAEGIGLDPNAVLDVERALIYDFGSIVLDPTLLLGKGAKQGAKAAAKGQDVIDALASAGVKVTPEQAKAVSAGEKVALSPEQVDAIEGAADAVSEVTKPVADRSKMSAMSRRVREDFAEERLDDATRLRNVRRAYRQSDGHVVFQGQNEKYIVSKDTHPGGKWRSTYVDDAGNPVGHETFETLNDALKWTSRRAQPPVEAAAIHGGSTQIPTPSAAKVAEAEKVEAAVAQGKLPLEKTSDGKYAEPSAINLERLAATDEGKQKIRRVAEERGEEILERKGPTMTNEEVVAAAESADLPLRAITREASLKDAAETLRARQHLVALANEPGISPGFIDVLEVVSSRATKAGRELQAFKITADPELYTPKAAVVQQLLDKGVSKEDIAREAAGITDWNDARQVVDFYRRLVKPSPTELLAEYRYINMLSSPKTHLVNFFSNTIQATTLRPAVRLVSGMIDPIGSRLSGKQREYYMRQVPAYYKGMVAGLKDATQRAARALSGQTGITNLDLNHIPTGNPILRPFEFIPRALEAGDVFFRGLIEAGEREALAVGQKLAGKPVREGTNVKAAAATAEELVFRKHLDTSNKTGQGKVLSLIDHATAGVEHFRKIPGGSWVVPFLRTPMNILKQGVEYSPIGFATLAGNAKKTEQLAKPLIGSMVFAGATALALEGRTTWGVPKDRKERELFWQSGRKPYSIKIGDTWVSYSKLGPLAYPIAMASAMQYYSAQNPSDNQTEKIQAAGDTLFGIVRFFGDQSYMQALGQIIGVAEGEPYNVGKLSSGFASQLVPLASLVRWANTMIDPIYRKSGKITKWADLPPAIIQNLKKQIPGLSQDVEPYLDEKGQPSRRYAPALNAVVPTDISATVPIPEAQLQRYREEQRRKAARKAFEEQREK